MNALDPQRLRHLLLDSGVAVDGDLHITALAGGRSNLTYKVTDGNSTWVARRPPLSGLTTSAHDMVREYTVVAALRDTDVPVAAAVACDPDGRLTGSPLCVVEYLPGVTIRDSEDLAAFTDAQVAAAGQALIQTLVALHAVDYRAVGLDSFGRPDGFVTRQAKVWARQWQQVKTREIADVDRLAAALNELPAPVGGASIVHGDYRIDNTLFDRQSPERILGVVDWEMSTLGDPLTDVALACAYRSSAFDDVLGIEAAWTSTRLPAADDIAQQYAAASGRELSQWSYYSALANFKIAVIAEGIAFRSRSTPGSGVESVEERPARATPVFAAAGLRALRSG